MNAQEAMSVDAKEFTNLSIGKDLRKMREAAGLRQVDVARQAGVRPETLSRIEHGKGNPTVNLIQRVIRSIKQLKTRRS